MPFKFACPGCGIGYNVKEKLAGKKTKCQKCGEIMTLNPLKEEATGCGSPVYRHVARDREFEPAIGDGDAIDAISNHVEKHVGPVESVFHELLSDMFHLDVHWVKPTVNRPWHVFFTTGVSERPMTVPEGAETSHYLELVMCLPGDWPISDEAFEDEGNYWPIRWLKFLGRLPHEYESWLGYGHSVPNGDPAEPLGSNTECIGSILLPPPWFGEEMQSMHLDDDREINFLSPIPVYQEEMDLKLNKGIERLIDRFERAGLPMDQLFDPKRKNVAKKRFGFF